MAQALELGRPWLAAGVVCGTGIGAGGATAGVGVVGGTGVGAGAMAGCGVVRGTSWVAAE